jgi:hypothetical protein
MTDGSTVMKAKITGNPEEPLWELSSYIECNYWNIKKVYIDCSGASELSTAIDKYRTEETLFLWVNRTLSELYRMFRTYDPYRLEAILQSLSGPVYSVEFINPDESLATIIKRLQSGTTDIDLDAEDQYDLFLTKYLLTITYE